MELAHRTNDNQIIKLSQKLQSVVGVSGRMRYPDALPYPKVPHDVFKENHAMVAMKLTQELFDHIHLQYLSDNGDE